MIDHVELERAAGLDTVDVAGPEMAALENGTELGLA